MFIVKKAVEAHRKVEAKYGTPCETYNPVHLRIHKGDFKLRLGALFQKLTLPSGQLDEDLRRAVEQLSEKDQQRFWQLADSHSPGCGATSQPFCFSKYIYIYVGKSEEVQ